MKQEKNTLGAGDGLGATKMNTSEGKCFKLRMRVKTFLWLMALAYTSGGVTFMWALIKLTPNDTANNNSTESRYYEEPHPEEENELPRAVPLPSGRQVRAGQNTGATSLTEADFQKLEQELAAGSAKKSGTQDTNSDIMSMVYGLVDSAKKALGELAAKGTPPESVSSDFDITSDCCVSESVLNKVFKGVLKGKGNAFIESGKRHGISPLFLAGVALHESDNGGSRMAKELKNVLGVMTTEGPPKRFDSVDDCVDFMAGRLKTAKYYVRGGNKTVAKIQKSYCPVGADNDPTGLNKYWLNGVVASMNKILDAGKVASK